MHPVDWSVLIAFVAWIVYDGLKRTKDSHTLDGYFLAKRSIPWWAAGLSVMATQLSAITMIGTTGQGYTDGMRFIQFYFGLPLAMIILSVTLVPFFYRSGVYTAYEYLERRFDAKTRTFTSLLFLISRGMSCGAVVSAPAVVLSLILGWDLTLTALAITVPAVIYTMWGGVQAVTWTDVKIMGLIVFGLFAVIVTAIVGYPDDVGLRRRIAGCRRRRTAPHVRVLVRSHQPVHVLVGHHCGALSLLLVLRDRSKPGPALSDRALGGRSAAFAADERVLEDSAAGAGAPARHLRLRVLHLQSAAAAVQQRAAGAIARGPARGRVRRVAGRVRRRLRGTAAGGERAGGGPGRRATPHGSRRPRRSFREREASMQRLRGQAAALVKETTGDSSFTDVNYIIPTFILTQLPVGLVGLLIVAILLAATDTIAGELNSLSTATVIDFYKRWFRTDRARCPLPRDLQARRPASGDSLPAWSLSGRPSSAR